MAEHPALSRVVMDWAERLAPMDAATPIEVPPAHVWRAGEPRTASGAAPAGLAHGWLTSLAFWRGFSVAAITAAAALIIYVAAFPSRTEPPTPSAGSNSAK